MAFEIESTTSMTSALRRVSNVANEVPKYMIIPQDREAQFLRKMKSPLFYEHFKNENWHLLYFEKLKEEYSKHKRKTDIFRLINKKVETKLKEKETESAQQLLKL